MENELTKGPVMQTMLRFAVPMILGDLLQQCYNIADTLIVGRYLGESALAAVGSAFSLMTFLTSIILGLAMGSGTVFSIRYGQKDEKGLKEGILASFALLASVTVILNILVFAGLDLIIWFLRTPEELVQMMRDYLAVIFAGLVGIFLYNFFASLLRSLGNSVVPLAFLAVSACLNIVLDLWFVTGLHRGVAGAAEATVIAQYVSGIGIAIYTFAKFPQLLRREQGVCLRKSRVKEITSFSALTCMQQSIMNLGILAVQGLVNSFGTTIMAAFAAAVKIDAFAYLPVQDFGNAFSIFTAQNYGAKKPERIKKGIRTAVLVSVSFSLLISLCVCLFAAPLMFPALRTLPGPGTSRHVRGAHRRLSGDPRGPGLRSVRGARLRRRGYLVVRADWLVPGGRPGNRILRSEAEKAYSPGGIGFYPFSTCIPPFFRILSRKSGACEKPCAARKSEAF